MTSRRKVAFAATFSSACIHRRMRGALSYADANPHIVLRDFRMPLDSAIREGAIAEVAAIKAWKPSGILAFMDNLEFEAMLKRLGSEFPPIVSMAAVTPRPGVVLVGGSMPKMLEMGVQHFRQQGLRSLGMLILDHDPLVQERGRRVFCEISKPADPAQAVHVEMVPADLPADLDCPVEPVPPNLAAWLARLPKPAGVMTVDYGGGNYLVRVCHALGLRVPEDVAVICVDDVDLCL
jgi:DNA-binding LacI/PurR family transcriptional regulator